MFLNVIVINLFWVTHIGEGETYNPGKEIPKLDWREDFPQFS